MGARLLLVLSAYSPLLIVVGILRSHWTSSLGLIVLGLLLGAGVFVVEWTSKRHNHPDTAVLKKAAEADGDVAGYLTTYILPFVTLTLPGPRSATAYIFFCLMLIAVLAQSSRLALNPWLFLARQRVYVIDVSGTDEFALCSTRSTPRPGDSIKLYRLVAGLYYLEVV